MITTSNAPAGRLWTAQDVAGYLGVPLATLYQWRYLGTGQPATALAAICAMSPPLSRPG